MKHRHHDPKQLTVLFAVMVLTVLLVIILGANKFLKAPMASIFLLTWPYKRGLARQKGDTNYEVKKNDTEH